MGMEIDDGLEVPALEIGKLRDFYQKLLSDDIAHMLTKDEKEYCRKFLEMLRDAE